jgi:heavy metal translocating P-type ATPase
MKKIKIFWRFVSHYYLFFVALSVLVVALGLTLGGFSAMADVLLIGIIVAELLPLLWGMLQDLRQGKYGVDILAATAIITAVVMGEYWAGLVIVLMLTGGQALEDYAGHRAENELEALLKRAPHKARVVRGRKEVEVKASEVREGDKIIVRAGEIVPVDAVVLEGSAGFDESSLTGESLPQLKETGADILSGSVNLDGAVTARARNEAAESQYQQIIKLVKSARASQAPFVRLADQYAVPFTIVSFVIAGGAWALSGDSLRFLQVLVVATPCPLILAAPIAIISGMSRAARHGIIMKNGGALERLARARTFAFDKTGTITRGTLAVGNIKTYHGFAEADVLSLAASLEQHSNHAQAQAITAHAAKKQAKLLKTKNVRELAGKGLVATAKGKHVIVGRLSLLEENNVDLPKGFDAGKLQSTAACVAVDGKLAGVVSFADEVREESKSTLKRLRDAGVKHFLMVTGDNERTAQDVAKQVGIKEVKAQALPGEKLMAIEAVKERPVAFVGDGVNDAPVLTASDVGIALGARGAPAASQSADVVVMLDDLGRVALGTEIAKRSLSVAKQAIWIGIGLSVILMLIYATGRFSPVSGALIQELVDIVVIVYALRAHGSWKRRKAARGAPASAPA